MYSISVQEKHQMSLIHHSKPCSTEAALHTIQKVTNLPLAYESASQEENLQKSRRIQQQLHEIQQESLVQEKVELSHQYLCSLCVILLITHTLKIFFLLVTSYLLILNQFIKKLIANICVIDFFLCISRYHVLHMIFA